MTEETVYKAQEKAILGANRNRNATLAIAGGVGLLALTLTGVLGNGIFMPFFILGAIGATLMWPAYRQNQGSPNNWSFLAGPGAMMITLGALISGLDLLNHGEAFGYLWTMLPISVIAGLMYARRDDVNHAIHTKGKQAIRVLGMITVGLGLFLELLAFQTFGTWWPMLLIGYGVYLMVKQRSK